MRVGLDDKGISRLRWMLRNTILLLIPTEFFTYWRMAVKSCNAICSIDQTVSDCRSDLQFCGFVLRCLWMRSEGKPKETGRSAAALDDLPRPDLPAANRSAAEIEIINFNFFYGRTQALFDINLTIPAGRVTSFIGPSGCGKSTLLRSLNRMNDIVPGAKPSGTIKISGEDIHAKFTDVVLLRSRIGMVFQKSNPFPKSIFENVAYGLRINNLARNKTELAHRVEQALKQAALWDEVKDRLHQGASGLSGGQQQRLCIARALAVNPHIILMDEPASALDPIATQKIEELVLDLRGEYTIVIVTHNMQQAARISDYTAFFWLGKLIEFSETDRIFTSPENSMTEDYITGRFG